MALAVGLHLTWPALATPEPAPQPRAATARNSPDPWSPSSAPKRLTPPAAVQMLSGAPYDQALFVAIKRTTAASVWQQVGQQLQQRANRDSASPAERGAFGHWLLLEKQAEAALSVLEIDPPTGSAGRKLLAHTLGAVAALQEQKDEPKRAFLLRLRAFEQMPDLMSDLELERLLSLARRSRELPRLADVWHRRLVHSGANRGQNPRLWAHLSVAYTWLGRFSEAHAAVKNAGTPPPDGLPPASLLANGLSPQPPTPVAAATQTPTKPRSPGAVLEQAHAHLSQGDETQALALLQQLAKSHPRFVPGILGLGALHHRQGRRAMALETWQKLLRAQRPRWRSQLELAGVLIDHNFFDEARIALAPAMDVGPGMLNARRLLARLEAAEGNIDVALSHWAQIRAAAGDEAARMQAEAKMVALAPQLGSEGRTSWLAELTKRWGQAAPPAEHEQAGLLLAATQAALGMTDEALATLAQAQVDHPRSVAVARMAVANFKQRRQTSAALRWLQSFTGQTPPPSATDQAWALAETAELQLARGNLPSAEALLQQAQALAPHPRVAVKLAQLQERQQTIDPTALARMWATLDAVSDPSNETILRAQLETHARQGQWEQAFAVGASAAKSTPAQASRWWDHLLAVCLAEACLSKLEHLVSTHVPSSPEADEIHLRLLERLLPPTAKATADGDPLARAEQKKLVETGLAPLVRYLVFAAEPEPERIALAAFAHSPEVRAQLLMRAKAWLQPSAASAADKPRALAALWALARLGGGLPGPLFESAWTSSSEARVLALYGLGRGACALQRDNASSSPSDLSNTEAVANLKRGLQSRVLNEALMAVWALGQFGTPDAIAELTAVMTDATTPPSLKAMAALWLATPNAPTRLQSLANSTHELVALSAVSGLAHLGTNPARLALWTVALQADEPRSRMALSGLGRPSQPRSCWSLPLQDIYRPNLQGWMVASLAAQSPTVTWATASSLLQEDRNLVRLAMLPAATWAPDVAERAIARLSSALQQGLGRAGLLDFLQL